MRLIDLHADTLLKMKDKNITNMKENKLNVDINKLKKADSLIQVFAIYNDLSNMENMYEKMMDFYEFYIKTINSHDDELRVIKTYEDINMLDEEKKIGVLISIEDSGPVDGKFDRINDLYKKGIRMMSFTHNYENCFGYPNSKDAEIMNKGLKKFGLESIELMNELGIIIDVSHLSDGGIYDTLKYSKEPIIASHSNARTVRNVTRNMTDDMIKKLADKGGIIGLNFCGHFLGDGEAEMSTVENMVKHVKHIVNVGGIECMACGTDYDGIPDNGIEIQDIGQIEKLELGLRKAGFNYNAIEKIYYKNALRLFRDFL